MPDNVSFLPEDYLEKRTARRTNVICLTLFMVVMVGIVAAYFVTDRQRSEIRHEQMQVNKQFQDAARRIDQLDELQSQKQQMLLKAKIASVLVERVPRTLLLSELINHMPNSLSLLEMDLETKVIQRAPRPLTAIQKAKAKDKAKAEKNAGLIGAAIQAPQTQASIKLVGVAPTDVEVAKFITALSNHPMFDNVNLLYSEQTKVDTQRMRKFAISLEVNQGVDLRHLQPTMVKRQLKMNPMGNTVRITPQGAGVVPAADRK